MRFSGVDSVYTHRLYDWRRLRLLLLYLDGLLSGLLVRLEKDLQILLDRLEKVFRQVLGLDQILQGRMLDVQVQRVDGLSAGLLNVARASAAQRNIRFRLADYVVQVGAIIPQHFLTQLEGWRGVEIDEDLLGARLCICHSFAFV